MTICLDWRVGLLYFISLMLYRRTMEAPKIKDNHLFIPVRIDRWRKLHETIVHSGRIETRPMSTGEHRRCQRMEATSACLACRLQGRRTVASALL